VLDLGCGCGGERDLTCKAVPLNVGLVA
jgi:hypothetical protein